jgi:hypothetical protein
MDNNVTIAHLKNLVIDKPAPITTKLAQIEKDDKMKNMDKTNSLAQGVPVHVNPVIMKDTMGDAKLDMHILVGPDEVELKKKQAAAAAAKQALGQKEGTPVYVNPVLMSNSMGDANLGMKMRVGPDEVQVEKKNAQKKEGTKLAQTTNPVWNPPFNNWSVNQPSGPHQTGLSAYQDLGQNMIVDGHRVHY